MDKKEENSLVWKVLRDESKNQELGLLGRLGSLTLFFGNKNFSEELFSEYFPHAELLKIKQVHGTSLVLASHELQEADAHFSASSHCALQIKTADCIPLLAFSSERKIIMSIHAGWRGVVGKIAELAMEAMQQKGVNPSEIKVVIGPHIRKQSFEVDQPVWVQLMDSIPVDFHHEFTQYFEQTAHGKYYVDLEGIVKLQLRHKGIMESKIESIPYDTLTDFRWHSFRRDRELSGRNISFIMRT